MHSMNKLARRAWWIVALAALVVVSLLPGTAQADQALPPYAWYAVAWTPQSDTLHWIGPLGEVASMPRPKLPGESADPNPQMRISPDGRTLVMVAQLNQGNSGLGFFDLNAGAWLQTHTAQPGESVFLGPQSSFSATTGRVAVGFMSGDYASPAWRVIVFDVATGDAIAGIDQTHPQNPAAQLSIPAVRYFGLDEGLGELEVHIQFIPYGTDGSMTYNAYRWLPFAAPANQGAAFGPSPYTRAESDINLLSGDEVFAYEHPNYGTLPAMGPGPTFNAIGHEIPQLGADNTTAVWVDGTSWNYRARWAAGGQWVLYYSNNEQDFRNWNIVLANGTPDQNQRTLLGPLADAVGTPDGALMVDPDGTIRFTNNNQDATGTVLFTPGNDTSAQVIYVTPAGVQFTLSSLGDLDVVAVPPGPGDVNAATPVPGNPGDVAPPQACPGAPPARLTVGQQARVTFTDGSPLNLRTAPSGQKIADIAEGTVADVIAGPQCVDGFYWWQISVVDGAAVGGWAAEGDLQSYYLEPWSGTVTLNPGVIQAVPTSTPVGPGVIQAMPTPTPPVLIFVTPIPEGGNPGDISMGDCSLAPAMHVQVGMLVRTAPTNGTYALYPTVDAQTPQNQVQPNTQAQIVGGPGCKNGYRMWQVTVVLNGQNVTGWISEGTQQMYFINPMP